MDIEKSIESFQKAYTDLSAEVERVIVGHQDIVRGILTALMAGGHVLLEGVPGLGKTLLVRTLGQVLDLSFSRVQFTPDLMPADILGTNLVMENADGRRAFEFQKGPIFAHLVLADEINRATPKTQSAMLEAMQEHSVTAGGQMRPLPKPFFVLATQNPIDQEGTYPLPEAQLDRFFFKLLVGYPTQSDLMEILDRTTGEPGDAPRAVLQAEALQELQSLVRQVPVSEEVRQHAVRWVLATHPGGPGAMSAANQYLRFGSSPRGAQALVLAGKVRALSEGRYHVSTEDIDTAVKPALRHRLILNYEAEAEGLDTDAVLEAIGGELARRPVLEEA